MRKALRVSMITFALIVVLVVIFAVLAKLLVTPERIKSTVIPIAEKKLNRRIQLGEVKVSIFSGITLKDLIIMEKESSQPFIKAGTARLKYQFWPLLSKKVIVDKVQLDAPVINVIRMADGRFNYSDITSKQELPQPQGKPDTKELDLLLSQVTVTKGNIRYEDRYKADPPFRYEITGAELSASDIALDKQFPFTAKATLPGASVEVNGKAANLGKKPTIDLVVKIIDADVKKMVAALPAQYAGKAKAFEPSGTIKARIHLSGAVSEPKKLLKDGEVTVAKLQVNASGQRPVLEGVVLLKNQQLSSRDLVLTMAPNKIAINFTVDDFLAKPIVITSSLKADRFDLDPFLNKSGKSAAAGRGAEKPEPEPINLPIRANGTVQLAHTVYKGLPVTGFLLKYQLADNVLHVQELKGSVAGGEFSDRARINLGLKGYGYSTQLDVRGVQADQVVAAFAPKAAGSVFGALSLKADISGRGTKTVAIKKNVSGQGNFSIANGRLTGSGLMSNLSRFINLEQLRDVQFSKFDGTFRIVNGKVIVDSTIASKELQVMPKGSAGLDSSLDMSLEMHLAPHLTGKITRGDIGSLIADDKGWGIVPIKVTGTFASPKFKLDLASTREQLKQRGKEKLQEKIQERLLKEKEGDPQRPEKELLKKGLKGLFGN